MGGGVGLGTLPVTHGLGPEPAKGPTPPAPTAAVTNADEREAIWERQRQVMRDWNGAQGFWQLQQQTQQTHERMMAELERTASARAEQERIRAADVVYRYQTAGSDPFAGQRVSSPGFVQREAPIELGVDGSLVPVAPAIDAELEPASPLADYAILPIGDQAMIQAMADGTLEVFVDPKTGKLTAALETESGQRYVYGRVGRVVRQKVKHGDTIGFTPAAGDRTAPGVEIPGVGPMPPPPPSMSGAPLHPQLSAPAPKVRWPSAAREKQAAFAGGPPVPPLGFAPWMREPPPSERPSRAAGAVLLLGLGALLLAGSSKGRRRR